MKSRALVDLALLAIGAYVVYAIMRRFPSADDFKRAAGEAWTLATQPAVKVMGAVSLPGGKLVPVSSIAAAGGVDGKGFFAWEGIRYQITGRDPSGNYLAMRVIT